MNNYLTVQERLAEEWNEKDLHSDPHLWRYFVICCASWRRFRPDIPWEEMPGIFRRMNIRMRMSAIDQNHPGVWNANTVVGCDPGWLRNIGDTPGIIATFHTGSYRLLPRLLAMHDIPFALLVAREVRLAQENAIQSQYQDMYSGRRIQLIDAEAPGTLFAMRKALQSGRCLLAYIDGNTGSGNVAEGKYSPSIRFFDSALQVRGGLPFLAALCGCPLYPVVCARPSQNHIRMQAFPGVVPSLKQIRKYGVKENMQSLYGRLEDVLLNCPEEWEGWGYLHTAGTGRRPSIPFVKCGVWEANSLLPLQISGRYYALDARVGRAYPIGHLQFRRLSVRHIHRTGLLA